MAEKVILYTESDDQRIGRTVKAYERQPQYTLPRKKRRRLNPSAGSACTCQEIWCFLPLAPSAGTWDIDLTVNASTETLTFNWNTTSTQMQTELLTHTELTSGNVTCVGGPFPNVAIYAVWTISDADLTDGYPSLDLSSLTGDVTMFKQSTNF